MVEVLGHAESHVEYVLMAGRVLRLFFLAPV